MYSRDKVGSIRGVLTNGSDIDVVCVDAVDAGSRDGVNSSVSHVRHGDVFGDLFVSAAGEEDPSGRCR